jgi:Na+-driven multidrug efflux pump
MDVRGAAIATVISQFLSALWTIVFLSGKKSIIQLKLNNLKLIKKWVIKITLLGLSGFIMAVTNSAVQIMCNSSLKYYGGDLYVGIMTVINSIREIVTMPVNGLINAAQPVIGYNYGAKVYSRVRSAIKFMASVCITYTLLAWGILHCFPVFFMSIFNHDPQLLQKGLPALRIYFFGFFMMSLQFSGQTVFLALGKSKNAIFFSLLRKAFIVIPLTFLLPKMFSLGTNGVFLAEPISNFIGGTACFTTMLLVIWPKLKKEDGDNS